MRCISCHWISRCCLALECWLCLSSIHIKTNVIFVNQLPLHLFSLNILGEYRILTLLITRIFLDSTKRCPLKLQTMAHCLIPNMRSSIRRAQLPRQFFRSIKLFLSANNILGLKRCWFVRQNYLDHRNYFWYRNWYGTFVGYSWCSNFHGQSFNHKSWNYSRCYLQRCEYPSVFKQGIRD